MRIFRKDMAHQAVAIFVAALMALSGMTPMAQAANHREAPITSLDHKADITDFFAFRSYDAESQKVTFILAVDPLLEPSNGPNYHPFDPELLYEIKVDNNRDGIEDVKFQVQFDTEIRLPAVFTGFVGGIAGIPPITALDGAGSEGFSLRQNYSVTMVRGSAVTPLTNSSGKPLFAVPANVGPRTMPNYPALFEQGIYTLNNGVRVFCGTVDDPFWIDLGATFDSLNFRQTRVQGGILRSSIDADERKNYAPDDVSGFNVNACALEVPITMLTSDGNVHPATDKEAVIGTWGTTSRPRSKTYSATPGGAPTLSPDYVQIQRMGNPLINELIIGTGDKDKFSMSHPADDAQFASYVLDPVLAQVFASIGIPVPPAPRTDLLPLALYMPPICPGCTPGGEGPVADLLRLNTGVDPTPLAQAKRLGILAHDKKGAATPDFAGFPNGRRVVDDVTDIAARAVAGVLNPAFNVEPNNRIGDGVNINDVLPYRGTFPYVNPAHSGRDSRHVDAGESGFPTR